MTTAVLAEKPSVARDIAAALGVTGRREGHFAGEGYLVTWAIGHLVALPMLPRSFPLVVIPETRAQFAVVRRILGDSAVTRIVCATDAGREGELIFSGCPRCARRRSSP